MSSLSIIKVHTILTAVVIVGVRSPSTILGKELVIALLGIHCPVALLGDGLVVSVVQSPSLAWGLSL